MRRSRKIAQLAVRMPVPQFSKLCSCAIPAETHAITE